MISDVTDVVTCCPVVVIALLLSWARRFYCLLSCRTSLPLLLPPSTINYINSSLKLPPSMLLHFVTGNLSAVTLWPPATVSQRTGNRAYSLFYSRLCPAIQFVFPTLDIFWRQWSIFMAVLMSSHFCLSLISRGTAYRKMNYTTQWTGWIFCSQLEANLPWHDLADVFQLALQLERTCQHPLTIVFSCFLPLVLNMHCH